MKSRLTKGFGVLLLPAATLVQFPCSRCTYVARSKAELAGHMNHAHKEGDDVRWLISSTVCPNCNMEFESRERIIRHLQCNGSLLCRVFVFEICSRIDPDVFETVEKILAFIKPI